MIFNGFRFLRASVFAGLFVCSIIGLCGCESVAKKFSRKPKPQDKPVANMIVVPENYPASQESKEERYRRFFLYWSSWHSELIDALSESRPNIKKQRSCAEEAIRNLESIKSMLAENKRVKIDGYILSMRALDRNVSGDLYGNNSAANCREAENLERRINRDMQYSIVKGDLLCFVKRFLSDLWILIVMSWPQRPGRMRLL